MNTAMSSRLYHTPRHAFDTIVHIVVLLRFQLEVKEPLVSVGLVERILVKVVEGQQAFL